MRIEQLLTIADPVSVRAYPGEAVAGFLSEFVPCYSMGVTASPIAIIYDFAILDIKKYRKSDLKRAAEALAIQTGYSIDILSGPPGGFSLAMQIPRIPVTLGTEMQSPEFQRAGSGCACLGRDNRNRPVILNVNDAPHTLICGATGSGKSVLLHDIVISLLYKSGGKARFVMIDPKMIELTKYTGMEPLLMPPVTDRSRVLWAVSTVCGEIERRYRLIRRAQDSGEKRRFRPLYLVIDELADLMLTTKKEAEPVLLRIAQLGRACDVHIIAATQRPSRDILTGLIKVNLPVRVALRVPSATDSVSVLGHKGAEKLIGRGDAILQEGITDRRFQAAFVTDEDIYKIVDFYRST